MPAVSVSMSVEELGFVRRYQELAGLDSFSRAAAVLIRRGYISAVKESEVAKGVRA